MSNFNMDRYGIGLVITIVTMSGDRFHDVIIYDYDDDILHLRYDTESKTRLDLRRDRIESIEYEDR